MVHSVRRFDMPVLFSAIAFSGFVLLLGGCGGGDAAPATTDAGTASAAESDSPPAAEAMAPPGESDGLATGEDSSAEGMSGAMASDSGSSSGMMSGYGGPSGPSGGGYPGMGMSSGPPGSSYPGGMNPSAAPVVPARPSNFATWTDANFLDAARERDPKLLDAIDGKVKASPGDPKVAELLVSVLQASLEKPASAAAGAAGGQSGYPGGQSGYPGAPSGYPGGQSGYPGGQSGYPGMSGASSAPSAASPGSKIKSGLQSMSPPGSSDAGGEMLAPPQSSVDGPRHESFVMDSISMMIIESATAYLQSPAVGALAGKAGAMVPGPDGLAPASAGDSTATGEQAEMEAMPSGESQQGYPGGAYPGMQPGGMGQPGAAAGNGGLDDQRLVERIVDGLVQNGTPKAWQTVYGIAAGTVKTPVDLSAASQIVVMSLFRNMDKNQATIEQILVSLIDGTAAVPPESRASCLRAMATVSAAAVDKLTGFKALSATSGPGISGPGISGPGMSGPGMSGPGMSGPGMSGPGMSGPGMSGYPGAPGSGPMAGGSPAALAKADEGPLPANALMAATGFLWNKKAVSSISKQLEMAADPVSAADVLMLSATIPNKDIRHAELSAFTRFHSIGADGLNSTGFFRANVRDPGMQVVLKSLPRQKPSRDAVQAAPMDSWQTASQSMAIALRDQMRALSTQPGKLTPVGESFPVRLHKNAISQFSGMIKLPGTTGEKLKDAMPAETTIYYARTSFAPQRAKEQEDVTEHYEARASGVRRADQARGILWIDGVKANQNGTKRSTDVIIQAASGGGQGNFGGGSDLAESGPGAPGGFGAPGGATGGYSIEIIVVETSDPKSSATATTQASAKP